MEFILRLQSKQFLFTLIMIRIHVWPSFNFLAFLVVKEEHSSCTIPSSSQLIRALVLPVPQDKPSLNRWAEPTHLVASSSHQIGYSPLPIIPSNSTSQPQLTLQCYPRIFLVCPFINSICFTEHLLCTKPWSTHERLGVYRQLHLLFLLRLFLTYTVPLEPPAPTPLSLLLAVMQTILEKDSFSFPCHPDIYMRISPLSSFPSFFPPQQKKYNMVPSMSTSLGVLLHQLSPLSYLYSHPCWSLCSHFQKEESPHSIATLSSHPH